MSTYISIAGKNTRFAYDFTFDPQLESVSESYAGQDGAYVSKRPSGARKVSGKFYANDEEYLAIKDIYKEKGSISLSSTSKADYTGFYIITEWKQREIKNNHFEIEITLEEVTTYNVVAKYFTTQTTAKPATTKKTTTTAKKKTANTSTWSKMYKNCPVSKFKYHSSFYNAGNCVKWAQTILKKCGYYTRAIDGWYGPYTRTAVKKLQKKKKLKQTGVLDKNTQKTMTTCK